VPPVTFTGWQGALELAYMARAPLVQNSEL